jgi:hypothetical protein
MTSTSELIQELALDGISEGDKVQFTPSAALNIAQTVPSAPSGTYTQSGSSYIVNTNAVILA